MCVCVGVCKCVYMYQCVYICVFHEYMGILGKCGGSTCVCTSVCCGMSVYIQCWHGGVWSLSTLSPSTGPRHSGDQHRDGPQQRTAQDLQRTLAREAFLPL